MKNYLYILLVTVIFATGCRSSDSDSSGTEPVTTDTLTETTVVADSTDLSKSIVNVPSLWKVEVNEKSEKLKKPDNSEVNNLSPQSLVAALNSSYPEIHLDFLKISHDTAFIAIPESQKLTEGLGSTGAYNYLATAVYNITELSNVKYVNFKFREGDHASPGTYSRDNFRKLR